jgi:glutamate-1-semialdehyde 2,1-aminomutase
LAEWNLSSIERETRTFESKSHRSKQIFEEARELAPFGVHSNYRFVDPYPLYFSRAKGSRIWDADGNEYIDFNMGFGALVAGHSHPTLVREISNCIDEGVLYGFEAEDSVELAKIITSRFGYDMVKFSTTGAEATMHAVRLARAYTGRSKLLKFEGCYHGSHDALLVSVKPATEKAGGRASPNQVPSSKGIPPEVVTNTIIAPFNDLEACEAIVRKHRDELAAIILEPIPMNMGFVLPEKGFLEGLRRLADESNCLLFFDEIKTCGKFHRGAANHFGVKPDLCTMGKAIAGGFPLSVITGSKKIMETIVPGQVSHAGTFNSNPLSVRAAIITLKNILTESGFHVAQKLGEQLGKGYDEIAHDAKLKAQLQWVGLSGTIHFSEEPVKDWRSFLETDTATWFLFYISMMNRGIIPTGTGPDEQWTVSVQHEKQDVNNAIETFKSIAADLKNVMETMPLVEAL